MPMSEYSKLSGKSLVYEVSKFVNTIAANRNFAETIHLLDCVESVFEGKEKKFRSLQALDKDLSEICIALRKIVPGKSRVCKEVGI